MDFKKVELIGFKSFADKQEIVFDNGVTCIVGPNERVHLRGKISLRGVISSSHTDSRMRQSECNCCSNEEFIVHFPKNQKGRLRQKYF